MAITNLFVAIAMSATSGGAAEGGKAPRAKTLASFEATDSARQGRIAPQVQRPAKRFGIRQNPHVGRSVVRSLPGPLRKGLAVGQRLGGGQEFRSPESGLPDPRDNINNRARSLEATTGN